MTVVKKVALGACSQPNKSKAKAGLLDNNWKKHCCQSRQLCRRL